MQYLGRERRVHTVFMTHNREYHTRADVCVAVRDRKSGVWIPKHEAVGMLLEVHRPKKYFNGFPLRFLSGTRAVKTTAVQEVIRPERETVNAYGLVTTFA